MGDATQTAAHFEFLDQLFQTNFTLSEIPFPLHQSTCTVMAGNVQQL
jgi:hypothetical protein